MTGTRVKSGKFGRIVLGVNVLATLGLVATVVQGYDFTAFDRPEALERHLLWALGATLIVLFAHTWVFIYLLSLRRELQSWAAIVQERGEGQGRQAASLDGRLPAFWALAALILVMGVFLLGPAVLVSTVPPWLHGVGAYCALLVQILALSIEFRALGRSDLALALCAKHSMAQAEATAS